MTIATIHCPHVWTTFSATASQPRKLHQSVHHSSLLPGKCHPTAPGPSVPGIWSQRFCCQFGDTKMIALEACIYMWSLPKTSLLYAGGGTQASPASKVFVTFNRLADLAVANKLFTISGSKASFAPFIFNSLYSAAIAPSYCFFLRRVCSSHSFLKRSSSLPPSHVCISRVASLKHLAILPPTSISIIPLIVWLTYLTFNHAWILVVAKRSCALSSFIRTGAARYLAAFVLKRIVMCVFQGRKNASVWNHLVVTQPSVHQEPRDFWFEVY